MNANTLYEIFEATRKHDLPDLTLGMAVVRHEQPDLVNDDNDRPIREFIGRHYDVLVDAYKVGPDAFEEAVAACVEEDEHKEKAAAAGFACDGDSCGVPEV